MTFDDKKIHVGQIYEHCWGEARINRLLIDFEIETPWLGGRRTPEEIKRTAESFPAWFTGQLERVGVLDPECQVRCTMKDKSRAIEGGHKISYHFVFNIAGGAKVRLVSKTRIDSLLIPCHVTGVA